LKLAVPFRSQQYYNPTKVQITDYDFSSCAGDPLSELPVLLSLHEMKYAALIQQHRSFN